ncbi:AAA family ATPase [Rhizobium cauense]|uniref:AAA family ATPase n=1 Tax=Rhizobium cauense TaxID=1166683 RepID=UPI001C6DF6E2|nr:AAA family ATPase [Rhizobium cauense]MBW9114570.1 AAA family ATPase [Rhizobium cauense]
MPARLKTLVIENFRSLRGKVVIPLDAQVVLVHGSNGMGKTSVLSAIELGLTGKINHLSNSGSRYQTYLTNLGTEGGSIELTTSELLSPNARASGKLQFSDETFSPEPLLSGEDARFFAERAYLPQATLGRLLEIYDARKTNTSSPLTQFVKELLGLDPLDALVDGLFPVFNVTRIRSLVPDFRRIETQKAGVGEDLKSNVVLSETRRTAARTREQTINALLQDILPGEKHSISQATIGDIASRLAGARDEDHSLAELTRQRSELNSISLRWQALPEGPARDRAERERLEAVSATELAAWRDSNGAVIQSLLADLKADFPDLPEFDADPESSVEAARRSAAGEAERSRNLLASGLAASQRLETIDATIQRATARLGEIDLALSAGAQDARALANALAGIAPHVDGDICPVCERNYSEHSSEPLTLHIAARIAALTSEAGRLQAFATERANETGRLTTAQRERLSVEQQLLSAEDQADFANRAARMEEIVQRLDMLKESAAEGARLTRAASTARDYAALARRQDELSASIVPDVHSLLGWVTGAAPMISESIDEALPRAMTIVDQRIEAAEALVSKRVLALSEIGLYEEDLRVLAQLAQRREQLLAEERDLEAAIAKVDDVRSGAKVISDAAEKARAKIIKSVFNNTLNKLWRDLFVRLAPSEQFVPMFKLPASDKDKVEAVLETIHRSGQSSGSPGAMLSQGNLNTAALTLFLALHLSVPARMPWLVLDDPVQSMDDVHIAQFAALLRTLSKGHGKQLVVAVHERALFDYLTLELSPSYPGDSLIAVEITRNFNGAAVATPRVIHYEPDKAIAA